MYWFIIVEYIIDHQWGRSVIIIKTNINSSKKEIKFKLYSVNFDGFIFEWGFFSLFVVVEYVIIYVFISLGFLNIFSPWEGRDIKTQMSKKNLIVISCVFIYKLQQISFFSCSQKCINFLFSFQYGFELSSIFRKNDLKFGWLDLVFFCFLLFLYSFLLVLLKL